MTMYTLQAAKANKQQLAKMKTYSCPSVFNKAPHLSGPSRHKAKYMCAVKLLPEWINIDPVKLLTVKL